MWRACASSKVGQARDDSGVLEMRRVGWAGIYRAALRALPAHLRRKHGASMGALFAHELRQAHARGQVRGGLAAARAVGTLSREESTSG